MIYLALHNHVEVVSLKGSIILAAGYKLNFSLWIPDWNKMYHS